MGVACHSLPSDHRCKNNVLDAAKIFISFRRRDFIRASDCLHVILGLQFSCFLLDEICSLVINHEWNEGSEVTHGQAFLTIISVIYDQ